MTVPKIMPTKASDITKSNRNRQLPIPDRCIQ